jgi:hypothetical protein
VKETYGSIHGAIGGAYLNSLLRTHETGTPHVGVVSGQDGAWRLAVVPSKESAKSEMAETKAGHAVVAVVQAYVTDANRPAAKAPKEKKPNKKALAKAAQDAAKANGTAPRPRGAAVADAVTLDEAQKGAAMKTLAARRALFPDSPDGLDTANAAGLKRAVKSKNALAIAVEEYIGQLTRDLRVEALDAPDPLPETPVPTPSEGSPEGATPARGKGGKTPRPVPADPVQGVSGGDPSPNPTPAPEPRSTPRRGRAGVKAGPGTKTPRPRAKGAQESAGDEAPPAPVLTRPAPKPSARGGRTKAK